MLKTLWSMSLKSTSRSLLFKNEPGEDELSRSGSVIPLAPLGEDDGSSEPPERGNWTGRFDFLLSLLGYSVGLGNVWRFPYLCYNNGGGAFLIPFAIMLLVAGLPLMFLELSFGQFASLGPIAIYERFSPLFHGLGYGMVIVSTMVSLYYNMIIAWSLFYMYVSFSKILPWERCEPAWSDYQCYSYKDAEECAAKNQSHPFIYYNQTCFNNSEVERLDLKALAATAVKKTPAEQYFQNYVLHISDGIHNMGEMRWQLVLCLFIAWAIDFLCLSKGVKSSGKVVYFTALFPYLVLIILFFRGVTLPGSVEGIKFYVTPNFSRLAHAEVWGDAAVQIFFALSPAWGGLITLSSYNKFHNNCYKDSLIVACSNICTSFFAGFVIFSVIGYLAHELKTPIDKVVDQGAGLAFIVYPEVVTRLPVSPLWAFLFFFMLLTLGIDSQFATLETVTTAVLDRFPNLRELKVWVVLCISIFGFISGLTLTTRGGMYMLQLMDKYAASWSVMVIALCEVILIAWVYGADRFCDDIEMMIGKRSWFWRLAWSTVWKYISPLTLIFILFFNWVEYKPVTYGGYVYPIWADFIGWLMALAPIFLIVLFAVLKVRQYEDGGTVLERMKILIHATHEWGPAHKQKEYSEFNGGVIHRRDPERAAFDNPGLKTVPSFCIQEETTSM